MKNTPMKNTIKKKYISLKTASSHSFQIYYSFYHDELKPQRSLKLVSLMLSGFDNFDLYARAIDNTITKASHAIAAYAKKAL